MYDRGTQTQTNKGILLFIMALVILVILIFCVEASNPLLISQQWATIRICGYSKAAITLVKYIPQVYLNYSRKSTVGWSLTNVFLDFTGGAFSFLQLFINSVALGKPLFDESDLGFNIVKFLLSVLTMIFDVIFFI